MTDSRYEIGKVTVQPCSEQCKTISMSRSAFFKELSIVQDKADQKSLMQKCGVKRQERLHYALAPCAFVNEGEIHVTAKL